MPLDEQAAVALVGGDVTDLEDAQSVEQVGPEHVDAAVKAAAEADEHADAAERDALEGRGTPAAAAAAREHARFVGLRAAVTRRRAERHAQAERIKALHQVGEQGVSHAAALKVVHEATLADETRIAELRDGIRARIGKWNAGLAAIIADGAAQNPDRPPPSGIPPASSAHVYASPVNPQLTVGGMTLRPINPDHPDGLDAACKAAAKDAGHPDPSHRLVIDGAGRIFGVGRDTSGHMQNRIDGGELRELSPREREAFYAGGQP